jgi:hypothetical protein
MTWTCGASCFEGYTYTLHPYFINSRVSVTAADEKTADDDFNDEISCPPHPLFFYVY